jgi:DNA-binding CsgD family transcriptional regulator
MFHETSSYPALGDMLAKASIGFLVAETTGTFEHMNDVLLQVLTTDPEHQRIEEVLRQIVARYAEFAPSETVAGLLVRQSSRAAAIELRTSRAHYRVCASRVGQRVCVIVTLLAVTAVEKVPASLPDAVILAERFRLTRREADVAHRLARGCSNSTIATELEISPFTARRHTERVLMKLGARSRSEVSAVLLGLAHRSREMAG